MSKGKTVLGVIGVIFLVLFIISFARQLLGSYSLTFSSFLDTISTVPDVTLTSFIDYTITGSWGIVDFIRVFLNALISIINVLVYLGSLLVNLILTLIWCVRFVLGF